MKKNINLFLLLFTVMLSYAQTNPFSSDENYVYTKNCLNEDCTKKTEAIQYSDGLGRTKQMISIKATPAGKDIVIPIVYNEFGRALKSYLPIPQNQTQNGAIYTDPYANAAQSYGSDIYYYSSSTVESSPIGKPLSSKKPGADYKDHSKTFAYGVNSASDVKLYTVQTTWENGATKDVISTSSHYSAGKLLKNSVTDEDGNVTTEFVNGKGQIVMVRKAGSLNSDTYYVYNKYNQLSAVIPPLATTLVPDETNLGKLGYQYRYDAKGRAVEKKLPGKGWEYMVYDKADQLIFTQDGNLRNKASGYWLFTKYDRFGRIIYTGMVEHGTSRIGLQNMIGNLHIAENRSIASFNKNGMDAYYTNNYFPYFDTLLSVNYYDTYPQGSPARPSSVFGKATIGDDLSENINTKNLPTASYAKNLENDSWTKSYSWYDEKSRMVGTHSVNHLGGYTKTESDLDFAGVPQTTKAYHKRLASDSEKVITQTFEYDNQNRLKKQYHQIGGQPTAELLSENVYNELSQVSSKAVGNNLETIAYTYNIRGSLVKINDPVNLGTKLFGYELKYYAPASTTTGKRSGNVEETLWKSTQDGVLKKYSYQYDALNRMSSGVYTEPGAAMPKDNFYNELLTYDLGGNISNLKRTGGGIGSTAKEIDDLAYVYQNNSNRLQTVTDSKDNLSGYPTGGGIYDYDQNGNMTVQADKGISNIAYNLLDLPSAITQTNGSVQYLYRADGSKLMKTSVGVTTDYVDGFQYEDGTLKFISTSEGYFNFENNTYIYHYVDHLGNIRLSFTKSGSGAAIIEESNFYPYGMKQENSVQTNPSYNYEHSGKEFQKETGWSDFGARMYMADIGRWGVIDPLAETTRRINPYNYALDNPISFVDPDGRKAMAADMMSEMTGGISQGGFAEYFATGGRTRWGSIDHFLNGNGENPFFFMDKFKPAGGGSGGGGSSIGGIYSIYNGNGVSMTGIYAQMLFQYLKDNISATGILNIKGFHFVMESTTPSIYKHTLSSFIAGQPKILHYDSDLSRRAKRRKEATGSLPTKTGMHKDEYPFASTFEGGKTANVAYVPAFENQSQGGSLAALYRTLKSGDAFMVLPVPKDREPDDVKEEAMRSFQKPISVPETGYNADFGHPVIPYKMWPVVAGAAVVGAALFILQRVPAIP